MFWSAIETFGASGVSLLTLLALTALLGPAEFGRGALVVTIVLLAGTPFEVLFHDALIQRRDLSARHGEAAFGWTLLASVAVAGALAAGAAPLMGALGQPALAPALMVAAAIVPLNAASVVVGALLKRGMAFRALARRTLAGRVAGALAGLGAGLAGAGHWSVVVVFLGGAVLSSAVLLAGHRLRPRLDPAAVRGMLGFAVPSAAAALLLSGGTRLFLVLLAPVLDADSLGHFQLAFRLVEELRTTLSAAAAQLALPLLARRAEVSGDAFRALYRQASAFTAAVMLPVFAGIGLVAPAGIGLLLGPGWAGAGALVPLLCAGTLLLLLRQHAGVALTAGGRPWANAALNGGSLLVALAALPFLATAEGAAAAWAARCLWLLPASVVALARWGGVPVRDQLEPLVAPLVATVAMAAAVVVADRLLWPAWPAAGRMAGAGLLGAAVYGAGLALAGRGLVLSMGRFLRAARP